MQTQAKTKDEKPVTSQVLVKKVVSGNRPQPLDLKAAHQVAGGTGLPRGQW